MKVLRTIAECRESFEKRLNIGFVPTMGALHAGHVELIRRCRAECETCVASIFVNPTQFGPNEDFSRYPRPLDLDLERATEAGADYVFVPDVDEVYSNDVVTVNVTGVSDQWEGAFRPGHFDGVATVVLKLFNIVVPKRAYFGLKDLQQCAVVSSLVRDLKLDVELQFVETIREASGLALSSRNNFLSEDQRTQAAELYRTLRWAAQQIATRQESVEVVLAMGRKELERHGMAVDYLALVEPATMKQITAHSGNSRIIAAVRVGSVRLLDNVSTANP